VSSISAASISSGISPTCRSNSSRRGEDEASTRRGAVTIPSTPQMQHANQCKKPPCGIEIDRDLVRYALEQHRRALVVQGATAHVDRLDLCKARAADSLVVAFANHEVVPDDPAKWRKGYDNRLDRAVGDRAHLDVEPVLLDRQVKVVWP